MREANGSGLIKWPGGKGRILSKLLPLLPREQLRRHFVDPFVGGGSSLLVLQPRGRITIGDIHPLLTGLYRGLAQQKTRS
ncbi:MAG: DNA adenine methylase, partial [Thermus sp.]